MATQGKLKETIEQSRVVAFDFDGTLVDTMGAFADKAAELINRYYGVPKEQARQLYLKTSGLAFIDQLGCLFPSDRRNPEVAEEFERWKRSFHKSNPHCRDEALEFIRFVRRLGKVIVICTNNLQENAEMVVASWPISIDLILGFDGQMKKGPEQFQRICETYHVKRGEILFIGDSPNDLRIALEASVNFIAIGYTFDEIEFKKIDYSVPYFKNFKEILKYYTD